MIASASILIENGILTQSDGACLAKDLTMEGLSQYLLSGGWLEAQNMTLSGRPGYFGHVNMLQQSGGSNHVSGELSLSGSLYDLSGGELVAGRIRLAGSTFRHIGGAAHIAGSLTLAASRWNEKTATQYFGALKLETDSRFGSNAVLQLPSGPCTIRVGDCSNVSWAADAQLVITNWSGSLYGGGPQRVIVGSNGAGLTPIQLSQIRFLNPNGLQHGLYPARILTTGEIVPDSQTPLPLRLTASAGPRVQLRLEGIPGENYGIEISTNLSHWLIWTSHINFTGTLWFDTGGEATGSGQLFYRARSLPNR